MEHRVGVKATLDTNDQAETVMAIREIGDIANSRQFLGVDCIFDLVDDSLGSHQIGKLGDDETGSPGPNAFDTDGCASLETSFTRLVRLANTLQADNGSSGGEIGAGDKSHELIQGGIRVVNEVACGIDDLAHVVRRHIRGHAHRDSAGTIDQQVGEARRKHTGLSKLIVVVRDKVDDVFAEVTHHFHRFGTQARFGVAGRCWSIIERSEVPMPVHHGNPHAERLREAHERVINGAIAMGMKLAHDITDDPC